MDNLIENEAALRYVLDGITFAPSCLDMGWAWEIETLPGRGWLINTTFRRPDTHTGQIGIGTGRKEFIAIGSSESAVVKTAWLLAELIVRHELMEAFLYKGIRIFDPHHTVEELSLAARAQDPQRRSPPRSAEETSPSLRREVPSGFHCKWCGQSMPTRPLRARLCPALRGSSTPCEPELGDADR